MIFCWSYILFRSKSKKYGRNPLMYGEKALGRNDRGFLCYKDRWQECRSAVGTTWLFDNWFSKYLEIHIIVYIIFRNAVIWKTPRGLVV